jgi:predicted kinase
VDIQYWIWYNNNMKQRIAYITQGLPASGKSTWAKKFALENPNCIRINNDDIRNKIFERNGNRQWSKIVEREVREKREEYIEQARNAGYDIIVDNTHMNLHTFNEIVKFCENLGFTVEIKDFTDVSVDECIRRDSLRTGHEKVGEKVILDMYNKWQDSLIVQEKRRSERVELPEFVPNDLPICIIVDLDGTLFRMVDRGPYDEHKVYNDEPRTHVLVTIAGLLALAGTGNKKIHVMIFSGRSENCFNETIRCLNDKAGYEPTEIELGNHKPYNSHTTIHMRSADDKRRDSLVKMDMYKKYVEGQYNVLVVFDDRAAVIRDCWKPLGLPVFRCGLIDADEF